MVNIMKFFRKYASMLLSILALSLGLTSFANAALPAAVGTAFTTIQSQALELVDMVWNPLIAITVAFIILRLFPKAANKAV